MNSFLRSKWTTLLKNFFRKSTPILLQPSTIKCPSYGLSPESGQRSWNLEDVCYNCEGQGQRRNFRRIRGRGGFFRPCPQSPEILGVLTEKPLPMLGYPTVDHSIDYLTDTLVQRTFAQ